MVWKMASSKIFASNHCSKFVSNLKFVGEPFVSKQDIWSDISPFLLDFFRRTRQPKALIFIPAILLLKPTMAVFKSVSTVEKCSVKFVEDDPKLVFEMHCKLGVKKTYKLNVEDCEAVQAVYDKSACAHELQAKPGVLISAVATFPSAIEDISFGLTKEHVRLKSYIDESKRKTTSSTSKDPNAAKPLLTELTLDSADFDKYQLGSEKTEVVFSLRDLKVHKYHFNLKKPCSSLRVWFAMQAVTQFCEAAMQPVSVYIDEPGKPLLFAMEMYNIFRADFVLATLQDHMEPQTDTPSSSQHPAHHQHPHHGSTSTPSRSTPSNLIPQHSGVSGMGASSSRTQSPGQQSPFPYQQGAHYGRASPQITPVPHYLHVRATVISLIQTLLTVPYCYPGKQR
jgi:cell cycle checkpoint control protein RAD9A